MFNLYVHNQFIRIYGVLICFELCAIAHITLFLFGTIDSVTCFYLERNTLLVTFRQKDSGL